MVIPSILTPVVQYYIAYGPILIMISLVLGITYLFISNFASIRSAYMCTSLKNVVTGEVGKCFSSRLGPTCKTSDIGFTHGWCNDESNYGPLRGTRAGPYTVKCKDWIWNKQDCPPDRCTKIDGHEWGWCADKGVQRAMRGQACGPYMGNCDTWVWQRKACPTQCGSPNCVDDSCVCTAVKARYVILKRNDGTNLPFSFKSFEVYDPDGYRIKSGVVQSVWPKPKQEDKSVVKTGADKNAYVQLDLGDEISVGRVIIRGGEVVGCAIVLRKSDNKPVLFRKIVTKQDVYDIPIGRPRASAKTAPPVAAASTTTPSTAAAPSTPTAPSVPATAASTAPSTPAPAVPKVPERLWKQITGKLMHISTDKDWTWGVNSKQNIFKCKTPCDGKWQQVSGNLKQIDVGGSTVWGVNKKDNIFWMNKDGNDKWHSIKGGLKHVSVGPNNRVWGVNKKDDVYMCPSIPCVGKWKQMSGKMKQIDVGDTEVWGVNSNNDIYMRTNDGSGDWKQIPGKLNYVSVGKKEVIGVNKDNIVFSCKQPCTGNWQVIDGKLKQVEISGDGSPAGVNSSDDIFIANN